MTDLSATASERRVAELLQQVDQPEVSAAELLCDRHPADAVAFTVVEQDLSSVDLTYGQLRETSERVAAALAGLGVGPGDRVATLMGKSVDLPGVLLGIWRLGAVQVPLFTAFAPPAIAQRALASGTKVIVADADQRAKLDAGEDIPADAPWQVVVIGTDQPQAGDLALTQLLAAASTGTAAAVTAPQAPMVEIFTSGTTGVPKGVVVPVRAIAAFQSYLELGLDVRAEDVFWNAADPGWAYGLYYGILGPLASGRRNLLLHAGFDPALCFAVLQRFGVTNFAAAPTVYRTLRAAPAPENRVALRCASSAGEPLTPEVIEWAQECFGVPVRDHYGQTEHGMMIINAWAEDLRAELRPGSMGRSYPGWTATVLRSASDNDSASDTEAEPGELGQVAIDTTASPLMFFTGYSGAPEEAAQEKTAERFTADGRYYLTGDAGTRDAEGFYFFSARDDDVIIMAGYRIGPFEIESVLVTHPAVADVAVVGMPDELRGEVVEAFVVLREGVPESAELVAELQQLVKTRYAAHAYPRRVHFLAAIPKTPSGKSQRYLLRKGPARP